MIRSITSGVFVCFLAGILLTSNSFSANEFERTDDRSALWNKVQEYQNRALPKSAIKILESIYDSASKEEAWAEATRALCQRVFLEGQIDQPVYPNAIRTLGDSISSANAEMQPMLETVRACYIYQYYMQNQWRFNQRSQTSSAPGDDFETWDLARLLSEVDKGFSTALKSADQLKSIPINDYSMLLQKGSVSDFHRPTVYDFVAFKALEFYSADIQFIRQQSAFKIEADSPIFASVDEFLTWNPQTEDEDSYLLRAVQLFQEVLRFHQSDDDQTAFLDANLMRLKFARKVAQGSEAGDRYRAALQRFSDQHVKHTISARALAALANSVRVDKEDLVEALRIAELGKSRFPDSSGGSQCHNIIGQIKTASIGCSTERIWNGDDLHVDVRYKNTRKVWFRLVKFDYPNWNGWGNSWSPQQFYDKQLDAMLGKKPVMEWTADLPETNDFKQRTQSVPVDLGDSMDSGCYLLLCSTRETFDRLNHDDFNSLSIAEIWISKLAVNVRRAVKNNVAEVQVFDAQSGLPVKGATVSISSWKYDGQKSREEKGPSTSTDANGIAIISANDRPTKIDIVFGDQRFGLVDNIRSTRTRRRPVEQSTVLFTDRSIYRPGQSIQFKGICYRSDRENNNYRTLIGRDVTVTFFDANNQEVEKKSFRTNEFGSFSGSFTAPRNRATGRMRLTCSTNGTTRIRVEEYKRPKFYAEIDKPTEAFQLDQKVRIKGKATAYTGASVDGSKVSYRVVRTVRYPGWWTYRYWYLPNASNSQEIANGETTTDANGKFEFEFVARPDRSVARESDPVFNYQVSVDITDSAGETRSAKQNTRIGYTTLQASLSASDWLTTENDVELKLNVSTLDGEGQVAKGTLKIYQLKPPANVERKSLGNRYQWGFNPKEDSPDFSKINAWPLGEVVHEQEIETDELGKAIGKIKLEAGAYRAVFDTTDPSGNSVKAELPFQVTNLAADKFAVRIPHYFQPESVIVEPGNEFIAVWGTGYDSGQAFIELEHRGNLVRSWWTAPGTTQHVIRFPVEEKHRGGFHLRITYVRENRSYTERRRIDVPWSNKKLDVRWEHFVSKLQPGGKETWTAVVNGPNAQVAVAELVAGMYDASLDAFAGHNWLSKFNAFFRSSSSVRFKFHNFRQDLRVAHQHQNLKYKSVNHTYRNFANEIGVYQITTDQIWFDGYPEGQMFGVPGYGLRGGGGPGGGGFGRGFRTNSLALEAESLADSAAPMGGMGMGMGEMAAPSSRYAQARFIAGATGGVFGGPTATPNVDLDSVSARKNLQETAFFFPHLQSDASGNVRIEFEIPEALTKWKFMGFAHDNQLRGGLLTDTITTSKDLMVQPNPPRFLREGDQLEFSVKVSNQSDDTQTGKVRLTFADARTLDSVDEAFGNQNLELAFEIPAKQSKGLFWTIKVPDFVGALTYKVVGATEKISDGEEGFLPVLSKRILVTESLPLPIRGNQTKTFNFDRLKKAAESDTLQSQTLTLQMTSNPSWYAVMALPYLMEYPHECSEQTFNRLYANALGQHIVSSDPKIERIFNLWRATDALDSPLEKNEELRNVLIAESPWLRSAKKESQARRDVGILFDKNRMNGEIQMALQKLAAMQLGDGAWPWFPGGRANDYITLYVTTGFGRLRQLGAKVDVSPAMKALGRLDWWLNRRYEEIKRAKRLDENNLSQTICLYLYGRSFFFKDKPIDDGSKKAFEYFVGQAKQHWATLNNRQSQGHLAIALKRLSDSKTPGEIIASLTERSLQDEEMGMFWREGNLSWWWYKAPIETQALMIEVYDEVAKDSAKVEELKIWLLKQKQTQNWKTTKATADACYGLLLRGTNLLASDKLVSVKLGSVEIKPEKVEAGTGFYEQKFVRGEIKPEMGQIEMAKSDDGIAWGSIHWQYLEDVGKIEPYEGTPLKLKKDLFLKKNTEKGPIISKVDGPVEVGDELVMRVELRVDRAMEYVHLKDYRGSGTEPVNVLSSYKYQDGLAYYESTKDTASHFFIDYLPRGTYVFEYSVRVQHRGVYETGIAELQCMYAPEFNSHSGSVEITVK